jgi:hypothetical protein
VLLDEEHSGEYGKKLFPTVFFCNCAAKAIIFAIHSWKLSPTNPNIFSKHKSNLFQGVNG